LPLRGPIRIGKRVDERTKELQLEIVNVPRGSRVARVARKVRDARQFHSRVVWEANPDTFEFSFVSEQAERLLGYPRNQWISDHGFAQSYSSDDQLLHKISA